MFKSICTVWINDSSGVFARWRHSAMKFLNEKKVNDCVQHIILQKSTNFHAIQSWSFRNICNEIGWPVAPFLLRHPVCLCTVWIGLLATLIHAAVYVRVIQRRLSRWASIQQDLSWSQVPLITPSVSGTSTLASQLASLTARKYSH